MILHQVFHFFFMVGVFVIATIAGLLALIVIYGMLEVFFGVIEAVFCNRRK